MADDAGPGTYALFLVMARARRVRVGRAGHLYTLKQGLHVYVGSALGPGGLGARLRRHAGLPARLHWHIDYLARHAARPGVLVRASRQRHECEWARWFAHEAEECMEGFGASDCTCKGHLFRLRRNRALDRVVQESMSALRASFADWRQAG